MAKFEIVSKYAEAGLTLPERATAHSAGYDFVVAEDILIEPHAHMCMILANANSTMYRPHTLEEVAQITKSTTAKPTLVPTGIKCQMAEDEYLEISVRSSCPLKYWLILANGVGIIDSDYYDNPSNEGEIFFQIINLSPFPIQLQKGDKIGQGIIKKYITTENDTAGGGDRIGGFGSTNV